tara:strand:- start:6812 stop:7048 length:237 start_codon:yes stop_codon:yes gene_type:complete
MENYWLVFDGKIYSEEQLRIAGWTDETLRAPYACRVRERTDEPTCNKRDGLIDDIEAICLSIEKRQNELSRLVKKLKG